MADTTAQSKTKTTKKRVRDEDVAEPDPAKKRTKVSDKEKLAREKAKEKARREKERSVREKTKEKAKRDKERAAKKAAEVRDRIAKQKARDKERKDKAKEKAKLDRERRACPKRLDDVRKPMSPWDVYRERMTKRQEYASMSMTEQTSALSALYKKRSAAETAQDAAAAEADRQRYEREYAELTPAQIERRREIRLWNSRKNRQKNKDLGKPPRAKGAFIIFSEDVRPDVVKANPQARFEEIGTLIGHRWKSLTDAQQQVYKDRSRLLRDERRVEVDKWNAEHKNSSMDKEQGEALTAATAKKKSSKVAKMDVDE